MSALNNRILVVNNDLSVSEHICATLFRQPQDTQVLDQAAEALFGPTVCTPKPQSSRLVFEIDIARDGSNALAMVNAAMAEQLPYAALFCDVRLSGWSGLKTVSEIRRVDSRIEVVMLSAYQDYAIEDIVDKLGANISCMTKPFSGPDLCQMATRCVLEWNKAREMEAFVDQLTRLSGADDDHSILAYLGEHLSDLLGIRSLAIFEKISGDCHQFKLGAGALERGELANNALAKFEEADVENNGKDNASHTNEFEKIPLPDYGVILIPALAKPLSPEKHHLCTALIEHTVVALKNFSLSRTLIQKQRMAEIGRTASHICHDIRMPIMLTETLVRLLINGDSKQAPKIIFDKIIKSLKQADYMANDILLFSNNQLSIEPRPCRVSSFIKENRDYWEHLSDQLGVSFSIETEEDFKAAIDRHRLARVVSNLIKNAVEATQAVADPKVVLRITQENGRCLCAIIDNGPGIPPEVQKKLFTPFACTTKGYGHGFGLAIAQQIVALHQGEIKLISEPGCTQCILDLPMQQPQPSPEFTPSDMYAQPPIKKNQYK